MSPSRPPAPPAWVVAASVASMTSLAWAAAGRPASVDRLQNKVTLDATKGDGMQIRSAFVKKGGQLKMQITIENNTMGPLSGFAIQFNKNSFGLTPSRPLQWARASLSRLCPAPLAPARSTS